MPQVICAGLTMDFLFIQYDQEDVIIDSIEGFQEQSKKKKKDIYLAMHGYSISKT